MQNRTVFHADVEDRDAMKARTPGFGRIVLYCDTATAVEVRTLEFHTDHALETTLVQHRCDDTCRFLQCEVPRNVRRIDDLAAAYSQARAWLTLIDLAGLTMRPRRRAHCESYSRPENIGKLVRAAINAKVMA